MSVSDYRHLYGPVPSRRLGRSLGVDLVPYKVCSYDCVYCQLGRTTEKTMARKPYVAADDVLEEIARKLREPDRPDYITLAGSGEPTLNAGLGTVLDGIKRMTDIPVAVLTNGSLLWMPDVRAELAAADLLIPSLDAGDEFLFQYVNRPCEGLSFERMVSGLAEMSRAFKGRLWLEVMLLSGVTGLPAEVKKIAEHVRACGISNVQLNTVVRPPVEDFACPLTAAQLAGLAGLFPCAVDIIGEGPAVTKVSASAGAVTDAEVLDLLRRRPCTVQGLAAGLDRAPNEILKWLQALAGQNLVRTVRRENVIFYEAVRE